MSIKIDGFVKKVQFLRCHLLFDFLRYRQDQRKKMNFANHAITRRESIKRLLKLSGGLALAGSATLPVHAGREVLASNDDGGFIVDARAAQPGYSIRELTRKTLESAGGMNRFISKGDVVVIKPNVSWAREPHLAATTHPEVLTAVIELCQEAGAKKIRIADHTIHNAQRCFATTGVGTVAKETRADLVFPRSSLMRNMKLSGHRLDVWPVFVPIVEADKLINLPVAKVHGLSDLTLGMKNWIGAVGGRRYALHQDIHQTIVDLAQFFKPVFTLIDATRIMIRNGPSGGSTADVAAMNRLILSNDQVAADARAAALFGYKPEDVGFIRLAKKWGIGTYDNEVGQQHEVTI
jgi:uncharacterized protein (DUF362 family)